MNIRAEGRASIHRGGVMRFRSGFGWTGLTLCFLLTGCDQTPLTAPAIQAASSGGSGSAVTAPSLASAVAVSTSQLDVAWQDNSSNELGFEVHRSSSPGGVFSVRLSTGPNVTSFRDEGLSAASQYCYKIRALRKTGNNTGYSAFSNTACATTPAQPLPPAAPSSADAWPGGSSGAWMIWTDNSSNEAGFRVERSLDSGASWTTATTVGADSASVFDGGRASEQQVCYRIIAFNNGGDSAPSNVDCTTPPAGPTNVAAIVAYNPALGEWEAEVTWSDNSAVEDGYEVRVYPCCSSSWYSVSLPPNTTTFRFSLVDSEEYVEVVARKDRGYSDFSSLITVTIP